MSQDARMPHVRRWAVNEGFDAKQGMKAMNQVLNQPRLTKYIKKRGQWLSWYETGAGESNSLQDQWFSMLLSEMSYRVARDEAARESEWALNIPLVAHLLNSGYFSSQVLATRRMLDKRRDVVSLRRLINDLHDSRSLITREVYVCFDGTSYEPALPEIEMPGLQPSDSPFSDWNKSRIRQERFDRLSGTGGGLRSRDDLIDDCIFQKLDNWIDSTAASKLIAFSHKYLAHAAEQSSIDPTMPTGASFAEVEGIHKAVAQSMRAIYDIILSSGIYSEVVPGVPLGFFGKVWHDTQLIPSTARMNKHWDEMADERNRWTINLENELFN